MLTNAQKDKLIVGLKQSKKAIQNGTAKDLYMAGDCDPMYSEPLEELAKQNGVQIFYIPTMKELGTMCGINVGASCAVIIK